MFFARIVPLCTQFYVFFLLYFFPSVCFEDFFLQCFQSLSARLVQNLHRDKNALIHLNLQTFPFILCIPKLLHLRTDTFLCQGLVLRILYFSYRCRSMNSPAGYIQYYRTSRKQDQRSLQFLFLLYQYRCNVTSFLLICKCHHGRTVLHLVISCTGTASVKQIQQILSVSLRHSIILCALFKKKIQIFPVYRSYPCRISRLFHSSLYLQRCHSCIQNLR